MENQKFAMLEEKINEIKFEIVESGLLTAGEEWDYKQVVSPFNRLYFILEGEGHIHNDMQQMDLKEGHLYLIPAGATYDYKAEGLMKKLYIHFQIQLIPGIDLFSRCMVAMELPQIPKEMELLLENLKQKTMDKVIAAKSLLLAVISRFLEIARREGMEENYSGYEKQQRAISYVENHLSGALKVSEVAAALGESYYAVSRNFKRDTGIGLKEYMETLLMNRAKRLLAATDMRISEIAVELGFEDAFYFSRFFRKYEKMPPREYRSRRML